MKWCQEQSILRLLVPPRGTEGTLEKKIFLGTRRRREGCGAVGWGRRLSCQGNYGISFQPSPWAFLLLYFHPSNFSLSGFCLYTHRLPLSGLLHLFDHHLLLCSLHATSTCSFLKSASSKCSDVDAEVSSALVCIRSSASSGKWVRCWCCVPGGLLSSAAILVATADFWGVCQSTNRIQVHFYLHFIVYFE